MFRFHDTFTFRHHTPAPWGQLLSSQQKPAETCAADLIPEQLELPGQPISHILLRFRNKLWNMELKNQCNLIIYGFINLSPKLNSIFYIPQERTFKYLSPSPRVKSRLAKTILFLVHRKLVVTVLMKLTSWFDEILISVSIPVKLPIKRFTEEVFIENLDQETFGGVEKQCNITYIHNNCGKLTYIIIDNNTCTLQPMSSDLCRGCGCNNFVPIVEPTARVEGQQQQQQQQWWCRGISSAGVVPPQEPRHQLHSAVPVVVWNTNIQ